MVEKESALRIEEFFCNIRRQRVRTAFLQAYYKHLGYNTGLKNLPVDLKAKIASFLSPKELLVKMSSISKDMQAVSRSPVLWRQISIFAQKDSSSMLHQDNYLLQLIGRSTQLQVLSLKYCQHVNEETMEIISQQANPFFLRELYLDGCERINDNALIKLTKPRVP